MNGRSLHSSIILTRSGVWGQAVGIPTPPGMIAYIPKYVACEEPSPWRMLSWNLCRIIPSYGPRGLERVMSRLGGRWRWDPNYGARMPYELLENLTLLLHPVDALRRLVYHPYEGAEGAVSLISDLAGEAGVSVEDLGLTGSYALGIPHGESDVDLIVYGEAAVRMYDFFASHRRGPSRDDLGGITTFPEIDLSWRRGVLWGYKVTWTGAPIEWHCPPLRSYYTISPPVKRIRAVLNVEPGQAGALLYPPCVRAGDYWIVSYEYNLGGLLYEGGAFELEAYSSKEGVIYLGLREYPGLVRRLPSRSGGGS